MVTQARFATPGLRIPETEREKAQRAARISREAGGAGVITQRLGEGFQPVARGGRVIVQPPSIVEVTRKEEGRLQTAQIPVSKPFAAKLEQSLLTLELREKGLRAEEIRGTITEFKPEGRLERISFEAKKRSEQATLAARAEGATAREFFAGAGTAIAAGVVRGVVQPIIFAKQVITEPVETARELRKGVIKIFKEPRAVATGVVTGFVRDPFGAGAELATEIITTTGVARAAQRAIKASKVGRIVEEEIFIRKQPEALRPTVRAVLKGARAQERLAPVDVKLIRGIRFTDIGGLSPAQARALSATLKEQGGVLFGSVPARALSGGRTIRPKDIDIAVKDVAKFQRTFVERLPPAERAGVAIRGEKIFGRETGLKILDIKPLARLVPQRGLITRTGVLPLTGFGTAIEFEAGSLLPRARRRLILQDIGIPTQRFVKVGGIRTITFGEQITRKGLGTIQVILEGSVRRAKDPLGFVGGLRVQLEALGRRKPITPIGRFFLERRRETIAASITQITKEFKLPRPKIKPRKKIKGLEFLEPRRPRGRRAPSEIPSVLPSRIPSRVPSRVPSLFPSRAPSLVPSRVPAPLPSLPPSITPSITPSKVPTLVPSRVPSLTPSRVPSLVPTKVPTIAPPVKIRFEFEPEKIKPAKRKKLKRPTRFLPSLEAVALDVKGVTPKVLTGLEIRKIRTKGGF